MSRKTAPSRLIDDVLALLDDPEFCAAAKRAILEGVEALMKPGPHDERLGEAEAVRERFESLWGVPPPTSGELLDNDPRRRLSDAIAAGRWGLVLILPWTANRAIDARVKAIRAVVRKRHQDALVDRHAHLVRWLELCGFDRPTIARVVFGRRSGLRRPSKQEATGHISFDREQQLMQPLLDAGLTHAQAEQRVFKKLRGSEARASAAVRMTAKRYVIRTSRLNQDLAKPVQSERLSHMLTMLYRGLDQDHAAIRHGAICVRDAFLGACRRSQPMSQRRDGRSAGASPAMTESLWAVVSIFPWTTDTEIHSAVTRLRRLMEPHLQATERPCPFEPLSDALVALFTALENRDDVTVRRCVSQLWMTAMKVWVG
jgi:hypothetical protein